MVRYSKNKDIASLVSGLIKTGWRFANGSKHGSLFSPHGIRQIVPTSPSDRRAYYNFRNQIKHILNKEC